jgi:hypothetical protein
MNTGSNSELTHTLLKVGVGGLKKEKRGDKVEHGCSNSIVRF